MKKNIFTLLFLFVLIWWVIFFDYAWNDINYPMHKEKKMNIVTHPEFIPSNTFVKIASSWFNNLVSDFYWLDSIQYIWTNAVSSEYKVYLFSMLNLITDLNKNFTRPYIIWELLLPNYNERYEKYTKDELKKFENQSIDLWLKWIKNNCDPDKVSLIKNEYTLNKLWSEEKYMNPCTEPLIPYYLAYIYYWNKYDWLKSSEYYRITSANNDAPKWSRVMAAIMQWKSWDREKSILMFLSLAESLWTEKTIKCKDFSSYLWDLIYNWIRNKAKFNWKFIKDVEAVRQDINNKLWEKESESIWDETQCASYLNKAVREMNLAYIEQADAVYFEKNKTHAKDAEELMKNKLIDYLPIDFQQNGTIKMRYFYNSDTWHWDNKSWE